MARPKYVDFKIEDNEIRDVKRVIAFCSQNHISAHVMQVAAFVTYMDSRRWDRENPKLYPKTKRKGDRI
jgi:hypothetical protein